MNASALEIAQSLCDRDPQAFYPASAVLYTLASLPQPGYDEVVSLLLATPVPEHRHLRGPAYRAAYRSRVDGCILYALRPNPDLYPTVLAGALEIDDPSSVQYAVAALCRVQPPEKVAQDFLDIAEQAHDDWPQLERISFLFYYLGLGIDGSWRPPTFACDEYNPIEVTPIPQPVSHLAERIKAARKVEEFRARYILP